MQIFAVTGLVNGIIASAFGLLVISKNWKNRSNQVYLLMTLSLAVWSFSYWRWLLIDSNYDSALFWVRILSVGSLFIPVFFFHWINRVIGFQMVNRVILYCSYIAVLGILFFVQSPLFIKDLEPRYIFQFWPTAGVIYDVYFSYIYLGLIVYSMYLLLRSYLKENVREKKGQLLYIIIGASLGFGGGLTNFPLWFDIPILPYGNFLVAAFPFFLGYSVMKYKLFNAKTIATEILVFFISVVLFTETALSSSTLETVLRGGVFIIMTIFGVLLIRSVYREVSQREKIELLANDLKAANDNQVNLIHIMNHQIKGKLGDARAAFAELLTDDYGDVPEAAKNIIRLGLKETETGVEYVQGILKGLSAENGTLPYDMKELDLRESVKTVAEKLKSKATEKKLAYEMNIAEGDFKVTGDKVQLGEAIGNLINNSISYTPSGSVHVWLTRKGNKALIAVQDTGIGITEEDKPKLFKSGGRGKDSIKVNVNSTGYGLSFVKGVVDAHKGRVWVESDGPGKGSSFYMELPMKE